MVYAVTGGSGFIGSSLISHLQSEGHTVHQVKRNQLGGVEVLANWFSLNLVEVIFHLAAYGNHAGQLDHREILRVNILYSLNVFKAAIGRKVYNFSTSSVTLPVRTLYSISKQTAEWIAESFPNVVTIRPYSVYGPGEAEWRFIPTVCRSLRTGERITMDESATHDWVFVDDLVQAVLNGHTQIGTGEKRTNLEIVKKLEEISGKKLNYTSGSLRNFDNSNWVSPAGVDHRSIEEGLLKTWNWYKR